MVYNGTSTGGEDVAKAGAKGIREDWTSGDGLARVLEWVSEGREDKQIAKIIGIHPGTFCDWKNKCPEFGEAIKKARYRWFDTVLPEVENAAFKLAVGYSYKETTRERREVEKGVYELVVTKEVTKHQPANPVANMYWLQNRASDAWKDRRNQQPEADESGETGVVAIAPVKEDGDA